MFGPDTVILGALCGSTYSSSSSSGLAGKETLYAPGRFVDDGIPDPNLCIGLNPDLDILILADRESGGNGNADRENTEDAEPGVTEEGGVTTCEAGGIFCVRILGSPCAVL